MSQTLKRPVIAASIRCAGDEFKFDVKIQGAPPLRGTHPSMESVRADICQHARSVAANSRATDDRRSERLAAEVFAWAREVQG